MLLKCPVFSKQIFFNDCTLKKTALKAIYNLEGFAYGAIQWILTFNS